MEETAMKSLSRRTFLKTTAVASVAAGRVVAQASSQKIRVGIFGCRVRGPQVAHAFHRNGKFEIATLCDCDRGMIDEGMKRLGKILPSPPRVEQDFRRVLDDKSIDAVVVATPDHWHAAMTVMALAAGKHVYVEKPFSYNIADGRAMLLAAEKNPRLALQVGTQHRSCDHIREAGEFVRAGNLGKVGMVRCWLTAERPVIPKVPDSQPPAGFNFDLWVGPAPMRPFNEPKVHYNWHFIRDLGTGDMGNWGAHWLDSARQMLQLDVPTAVSGLGNRVVDDEKEWPDTATVLYEFPGLHVLWELRQWTTHGLNGRGGGVEINGEKGTVLMDRSGWWFHPKGSKAEPVAHKGTPMEEPHVENFAQCIVGQANPNAPAAEGFRSAVLCHLGNITSVLNRRVEFDPATMSIKGDAEAKAMESREYRAPWTLDV
jgi:predicted dehydrogenase